MLTPDRDGIEITLTHQRGARATRSASSRSTSATPTGRRSSPSAGAAHSARDGPREERRLLQPRRAREGPRRGPHAVPRRGLRQRRGRARRPSSIPTSSEVDIIVADPPRPARLRRAHRDQGQHEDARQGHPPRDGDRGGPALQRDQARRQQAPHRRARLLRARRRLDRAGLDARDASTSTSRSRERPTGTFQVGAGFSSIENFIATAQIQQANLFGNGQSLALAGADLGPPAAHQHPLLRAVLPRLGLVVVASSSTTSSASTPTSRRRTLGGALTFGYPLIAARGCASSLTVHGRSTTACRHATGQHVLRHVERGQRLPAPAAREPLQRRPHDSSLRPALTYDTRNNRLFPSSGVYLQGSTELAPQRARQRDRVPPPRAAPAASTTRSRQGEQPGSGFILKLNNKVGVVTSPLAAGRARSSRASSSAASSTCAAIACARSARACRSTSRSTSNAPPIPNGANIGGNLQYYSEPRVRVPDHRQGRHPRRRLHRRRQRVEPRAAVTATTTPAPQFSSSSSPCFDGATASSTLAPRRRLRHPLVLAARPAALRVGLPAQQAPLRRVERLRVHDRQLLLVRRFRPATSTPFEKIRETGRREGFFI